MSARRTLRLDDESSSDDNDVIVADVSLPLQDGKTPHCHFITDHLLAEDDRQRLAKLEKLEKKYDAVARSKRRGHDDAKKKSGKKDKACLPDAERVRRIARDDTFPSHTIFWV